MTATQDDTFRFLIVDDSRAVQMIIRRTLESCGYPALDIKLASDGQAALTVLETFKPDLIITDWHMPKMSGLEFCQQVRQLFGSATPIGFVTTESSADKLAEARNNGASFFINKPFKDEDFVAAVLKVLPKERVPADTPVAVNESQSILQAKVCQAALTQFIRSHEFSLTPCPAIFLPDLTEENFIGLYGYGTKSHPVAAIAVMDMGAVSILWGLHNSKDSSTIQAAISSKSKDPTYVESAQTWMKEIAAAIKIGADKEALTLTRSSIFNKSFQRLELVLKTNMGRADFKLSVPGIGEGLIAVVLL